MSMAQSAQCPHGNVALFRRPAPPLRRSSSSKSYGSTSSPRLANDEPDSPSTGQRSPAAAPSPRDRDSIATRSQGPALPGYLARAKVTRVRRRTLRRARGGGRRRGAGGGQRRRARTPSWRARSPTQREELDGYAVAPTSPMPIGIRQLVWSVATTERVVALTFDDGPDPEFTPRVLEVLQRYGIAALVPPPGLQRAEPPRGGEGRRRRRATRSATTPSPTRTWPTRRPRGRCCSCSGAASPSSTWPATAAPALVPAAARPPDRASPPATPPSSATTSCCGRRRPVGASSPRTSGPTCHRHLHPGAIVALHDGIGRGTFLPSAAFARELADRRAAEVRALPSVIEQSLEDGYRFVTVSSWSRSIRPWRGGELSAPVAPTA